MADSSKDIEKCEQWFLQYSLIEEGLDKNDNKISLRHLPNRAC